MMSIGSRTIAMGMWIMLAVITGDRLGGQETSTMTGKVTGEAGKPLAGVIWRISGYEAWRNGTWEVVLFSGRDLQGRTAEDGRFQIPFRGKVRYDLQFEYPPFGPVFLYQISSQSEGLHVVMRKGIPVEGGVTQLGTGNPITDAVVVEMRLPNSRGT